MFPASVHFQASPSIITVSLKHTSFPNSLPISPRKMEQPIISAAFFDEEWESLSKMFSSEDADFMLQLHGNELLSGSCDAGLFLQAPASFWPLNQANMENVAGVGESFLCYDDANFQNVSQESSHSSGSDNNSVGFSDPGHGLHLSNDMNIFQLLNDSSDSIDFCAMDEKNDNPGAIMAHILCPRDEMDKGNAENQRADVVDSGRELQLKRKFAKAEEQTEAEEKLAAENPKKKSRASRNRGQKNKRNVQPKPKKNGKARQVCKDDEENNGLQNGQSCCSYSSEDDSNASQEGEASDNKEPALNLNGKARASRGSATDPQSLYARRRRERINERLRILQNLIPNGTKVDISTMLEEAVHYVKFLQLQIKLLSSDDMWMYAPIVYNGLDIGLCGRIFSTQ